MIANEDIEEKSEEPVNGNGGTSKDEREQGSIPWDPCLENVFSSSESEDVNKIVDNRSDSCELVHSSAGRKLDEDKNSIAFIGR